MGLSDGERREKMIFSIHRLTTLGRDLASCIERRDVWPADHLKVLVRQIEELWHAYLGQNRNGSYWLSGGELGNPVKEHGTPWASAILAHCEEHRKDDSTYKLPKTTEFDPFNGYLDIPGLVRKEHNQLVYKIYDETEGLAYGLRRYDDKLLASYATLDRVLSDIQGSCFGVFAGDTAFAQAYVGNRICETLYADEKAKTVFTALYFHHNLARVTGADVTLTEVLTWDRWQRTHLITTQNILVLALRIAGPTFHYPHQHEKMIELTRGMNVKESALRAEFKKCFAAHAEAESKEKDEDYATKWAREADYAVHGYDALAWHRKPAKKKGKKS